MARSGMVGIRPVLFTALLLQFEIYAFPHNTLHAPLADLVPEGLIDWCFMQTKSAEATDFSVSQTLVGTMIKADQSGCNDTLITNKAAPQIMECINARSRPASLTWQQWIAASAMSLNAFRSFSYYDGSTRPDDDIPLTIVVGATVSRLDQLYAQCRSWSGPLSAALFQPIIQSDGPLTHANSELLQLSARLVQRFVMDMKNVKAACKPDVLLVYERYQDDESYNLLYPCNLLRNLARLQARTPLIGMIDVDMLLSSSVSTMFSDPALAKAIVSQVQEQRQVLLLPAFNVRGHREKAAWAEALSSQLSSKEILLHALQEGIVFQFGGDHFSVGHKLINFTRWVTATDDYIVSYELMSEPWYIGDRRTLPWYDVRYRGYGLNKVQQVLDTFATGHNFKVLHNAFLIHRSHTQSNASQTYKSSFSRPNKTSAGFLLKEFVQGLVRDQVRLHISHATFKPALGSATRHCKSLLSWWQDTYDDVT